MTSSELADHTAGTMASLKVVVFAPRVVGECLGYPRHQDARVHEVDDLLSTTTTLSATMITQNWQR